MTAQDAGDRSVTDPGLSSRSFSRLTRSISVAVCILEVPQPVPTSGQDHSAIDPHRVLFVLSLMPRILHSHTHGDSGFLILVPFDGDILCLEAWFVPSCRYDGNDDGGVCPILVPVAPLQNFLCPAWTQTSTRYNHHRSCVVHLSAGNMAVDTMPSCLKEFGPIQPPHFVGRVLYSLYFSSIICWLVKQTPRTEACYVPQ